MTDTDRAKEYLGRIQKSDRLIRRLMGTVATLRRSLTGQNYELNPNKVHSTGGKNPLEETVGKIIDLEAEIDRNIDELIEFKRESYRLISQVADLDEQNVLIGRYIQGLTWASLAEDMCYEVRQIHRLHGQALLNFSAILKTCHEMS